MDVTGPGGRGCHLPAWGRWEWKCTSSEKHEFCFGRCAFEGFESRAWEELNVVRPCLEGGARTQEKALGAALQAEEESGEGQEAGGGEGAQVQICGNQTNRRTKGLCSCCRIPGRVGGPERTRLKAPQPLFKSGSQSVLTPLSYWPAFFQLIEN